MDNRPSWIDYFMNMVYLLSARSPDKSTKIGAVIVRDDWSVVSTGYNGFPTGVADIPERQERPNKYFYFQHAEVNAIALAGRNGHALKNCTMFTNGTPCADCARMIIQSGIKTVYIDEGWDEPFSADKWSESCLRSIDMFEEAQVKLIKVKFKPVQIKRFKRGEYF